MEQYSIYIVEDEKDIAGAIKEHLTMLGYKAFVVEDFRHVDEEVDRLKPHIILLDIQLPYFSGFYWCSLLRKKHSMPIIFLSGRSDSLNIVSAMELGGDEFIEKPFDLNVLAAKISAMIRRSYKINTDISKITLGTMELNLAKLSLIYKGEELSLSKNEMQILSLLFENAGKYVSKNELMMKLWDEDSFIDDNTLAVNMARLRKKLETIGLNSFIESKKNTGYMVEIR